MRQRRAPPKRSVLRVIGTWKPVDRVSIYTIPIQIFTIYAISEKESRRNGINVGDKRVVS